jgi:ABC-2 type transport system permease protein
MFTKINFYPIFKKEVKSFFGSWIAYILLAVFLLISGYFFYTDLIFFVIWEGNDLQEGLWQFYFHDSRFIMLLMIPLITMRVFSEEKKTGTAELLFTFPLKDSEIIFGKFFACIFTLAVMLGCTITYPVCLCFFHKVDAGPVAAGYLGLFLIGCSFISIGVFISSLTENQIVSAFVTFITILFFWVVAWNEGIANETLINIFLHISLFDHFYSFARGTIETKDIIYNIVFTVFFLFLTFKSLESRKWRGIK